MKIRPALSSDKQEIVSFCKATFSWGDYIERVWDYWFKVGRLFVVEDRGKKIGMSHVTICFDNKSMWLEGVRVHPNYRRLRIGTRLLARMIEFGKQKGVVQASAIVDSANIASQRMMEKNGFVVVSRWAYYTTKRRLRRTRSRARLATISDTDSIWEYLQHSEIFSLSARRYVKSWHWYVLHKQALRNFISDGGVIVSGRPLKGIGIINRHGYWDRPNILQVVYLDAARRSAVGELISYVANIYLDGGFEELQLVCQDSKNLTSSIEKFMIKDEEQFLLYNKVFTETITS